MPDPIPTPTFTTEADLATFQAMFAPRPYDPLEALAKAQALLPDSLKQDQYWLPLLLIATGGKLEWMLRYINFTTQKIQLELIERKLGLLSGGEWFLAVLALHLFNDDFSLPSDGLLNMRLLDDSHFELAMHAIRIHSRGVR